MMRYVRMEAILDFPTLFLFVINHTDTHPNQIG